MSGFMKFSELGIQESPLAKLAKAMLDKTMDIKELDKPLSFSDSSDNIKNNESNPETSEDKTNEDVKALDSQEDNETKKETRSLSEEEIRDIQEKTGWTDDQMKKCTIDEDGVIHYKCDNEDLEGKTHESSGVEYVRKTIDVNGVKVEVVVPKFDSLLDVQLPKDLLKETNPKQFKECNEQLKDAVEKDPELRSKFTAEQLEDIMDGKTPVGYTWHHDVETGKMQLVETKMHDRTQGGAAHTGGKAIWGGGY